MTAKDLAEPQVSEGPPVNGKPTTLAIFSSDQIKTSGQLPDLVKLINEGFLKGHLSKPELKMHLGDRLGSTEDFLSAVASDPEGFIIIIALKESQEVIGTASCVPWRGPPKDVESQWIRKLEPESGFAEWILKLMVTKPSAQGQGLAGHMMALTEREVVRRVQKNPKNKKVKMVLCTPKELNEAFYAKKGFQKDYETFYGEGYNFHVIHMSKTLD